VLDLYRDWSRVAPAVQVGSLQVLEEGGPRGPSWIYTGTGQSRMYGIVQIGLIRSLYEHSS
jgi:hypothetical protein